MRYLFSIISCLLITAGCIREESVADELKTGDSLPDFEVVMNDGTVVSDESLKGSISIVMFFHTTCPDCQQVLPRVQKIYDGYASKGVKFALVSREQGQEEIDSFWSENGLKMAYSAQNDRTVYEKFAQTRIPRIYINDKDGIIRYIYTDDPVPSYDDLESSLKSLIR